MLGRSAEVRAQLEQLGAIPHELTPAAFRAMDARHVDVQERVRSVGFAVVCLFGTPDDARRKRDLQAAFVDILGPDWAKSRSRWFEDGVVRDDRERMIQGLLPEPGRENELRDWSWLEVDAKVFGLTDEPRVRSYLDGMRARYAAGRAALPQRLKEQGLTLLPAPPAQ